VRLVGLLLLALGALVIWDLSPVFGRSRAPKQLWADLLSLFHPAAGANGAALRNQVGGNPGQLLTP
jgi:hypothetical protein